LEKWDSYRGCLEDPVAYTINPNDFLKPSQDRIDLLYHALCNAESLRVSSEALTEICCLLKLLLRRFEITIDETEAANGAPHSSNTPLTTSIMIPQSEEPILKNLFGFSFHSPVVPPVTNPNGTLQFPQTGFFGSDSSNSATPIPGANLMMNHMTTVQVPKDVLTERMQHDLISLTISILSGLLHHSDLIPKLPPSTSYDQENTKRTLVSLILDIIYLLWYFFTELMLNKDRFYEMINHLIKSNIIFAALYCATNSVSQAVNTKAFLFLSNLIARDDRMTILFIQSYSILPILHRRFHLLVNIDLLTSIQTRYALTPLNNSAELALRVKPTNDILKPHHIEPFIDLLLFYYQLLVSVANTYDQHYIEDDFISDLHTNTLFVIRYIQLLATQVNTLYHNTSLSTAIPTGLTIVANRSLYMHESPLLIADLNAATKRPEPKVEKGKKNADREPREHRDHNQPLPQTLTSPSSLSFTQQYNRISQININIDQNELNASGSTPKPTNNGTKYVIVGAPSPVNSRRRQVDQLLQQPPQPPPPPPPTKSKHAPPPPPRYGLPQLIMFRPILQITVDALNLISSFCTKHDNVPDIFLHRDVGIIPTAIRLSVSYKLERPLSSFSPSVGTQ